MTAVLITIRPAEDADAAALAELSGQLGYPASHEEIGERLRGIRGRGDGEVLVAEREGKVLGWIHVLGTRTLESPAHATIAGLVVHAGARGRGVGGQLLEAAEHWAASMGYTAVRVRSNVIRERAHHFYEQRGYTCAKKQAVFQKTLGPQQ